MQKIGTVNRDKTNAFFVYAANNLPRTNPSATLADGRPSTHLLRRLVEMEEANGQGLDVAS